MRITLIGSGNVATHLGAALKNAGHCIVQVYSRNMQHAALLSYHIKTEAIDNLKDINNNTDIFIIAVKDDAIEEIAQQLAPHNKLVLHTSGATGLDTLLKHTLLAGVLYPLQTFSKDKELDFKVVPLCIEGATTTITLQIKNLAQSISKIIYEVNSDKRRMLHLAAVFACNFPNYLYYIAQNLLGGYQLDFDMLRPLIKETADKVQYSLPVNIQTGPAVRNDILTMDKHLELLDSELHIKAVYQLLSQGIIKMAKDSFGQK